jgi:hypothetical protein
MGGRSGAGTATIPEDMRSLTIFSGVRVVQYFVFCVVFCKSLSARLSFWLLTMILSAFE